MFGKGKSSKQRTTRVDTLIGKTSTIKGDLSFSGSLHVEGTIIGKVKSDESDSATLVLDEEGRIEGDIEVANIIVNGAVVGDIYCAGHAELLPNAKINGTVYYNLIEMAVGSSVNGNLVNKSEPSSASIEYLDSATKSENS